ncbi:PilZ domain-containing protein [Paenibacillus harenae]|uniref:PilZ domain-containing protein n=1 Tax=Paenibacillus harenae TaxID=306543 RepID=UPI0027D7ADE3|nr:PilZ domain-containing protein [Paenibacillus harenae]
MSKAVHRPLGQHLFLYVTAEQKAVRGPVDAEDIGRLLLGSTDVFLRNIGPGGLRFMVGVKMSVNEDIIFAFDIVISGRSYKLSGVIAWCKEADSGIYEYGLQFQLNENERAELLIALNQLAIVLQGDYPSSMPFFTGDPMSFLKETKKIIHQVCKAFYASARPGVRCFFFKSLFESRIGRKKSGNSS